MKVSAKLRDAARAAAEAADTRNCPPDELAKKQELLDLNVFRVLQCAENIASGTYKMVYPDIIQIFRFRTIVLGSVPEKMVIIPSLIHMDSAIDPLTINSFNSKKAAD